jgi:TRAP-type C4-dicarboxylate transport system substrate-binding protein
MTEKRKIRWFIAHQPEELFVRTAKAFAEELKKHTNAFEIEILNYETYKQKYNIALNTGDKNETWKELDSKFWSNMADGNIEMSQRTVGVIGKFYSDFSALDLPFMFETHDHVKRVLEGEIGKELCENLSKKSDVRGLAFTYSGGYRVIGSDRPIKSMEQLKGKKVVVDNQLILGATMKNLGTTPIVIGPYERNLINSGQGEMIGTPYEYDKDLLEGNYNMPAGVAVDAIETTYLRFFGKHVLKTNHSMFLTSVIISNKFWESLTKEEQTVFQLSAAVAAKQEREWAIADCNKYEADSEKNGVSIVEISETERNQMQLAAQKTYIELANRFTPDLIQRIKLQGDDTVTLI